VYWRPQFATAPEFFKFDSASAPKPPGYRCVESCSAVALNEINDFRARREEMARPSKSKPVLNDISDDANYSTPLPDDSPPLMSKREAAKARHVSLKQCAVLINRDRNTIMKYLDQGMPVVERADRDRGVAWVLDLGEVVRWLEERAAENVSARTSKEGLITEDEAKRRRGVAQMYTSELEFAENAKVVARIHDMLDLVRKDYSEISLRLQGIPDAIAARVDSRHTEKVRKAAMELIGQTLNALSADQEIEKIAEGR
jgi:phage terminase Nu1 subunit (DNA packaging protein)